MPTEPVTDLSLSYENLIDESVSTEDKLDYIFHELKQPFTPGADNWKKWDTIEDEFDRIMTPLGHVNPDPNFIKLLMKYNSIWSLS